MIILQPNRELRREVIEADEFELSKKLNDDVVIIPSCYDIVSMDDTCELVEVAREGNTLDATERITEKIANEELQELAHRKKRHDDAWDALLYITMTSNNKTDTLSKEDIEDISEDIYKAVKRFRESIEGFRV